MYIKLKMKITAKCTQNVFTDTQKFLLQSTKAKKKIVSAKKLAQLFNQIQRANMKTIPTAKKDEFNLTVRFV